MRHLLKDKKGILGLSAIQLGVAIVAAVVVIGGLGFTFLGDSSGESNIEDRSAETKEGEVKEVYQEFKNSLDKISEYQVEYDLTHSNGNQENVVIYIKDDNTRVDVDDGNEQTTIWMNGKSVVEAQGQCVDLDTAGSFGFDPEKFYEATTVKGSLKSEDRYMSASSIGTKTIAGETTDCYEFVYETSQYNQLTTYCVTDKGIPALVETKDRDTGDLISKAEALSFDDSVSDEVLEPCEPNIDLSGF